MRIANCADLHARGKDLDVFARQWGVVIRRCIANGVDLLTIPGDIFDKSNIYERVASTGDIFAAVAEPLQLASDRGLPVLIIPGNHDKANPADLDAVAVLNTIATVHVQRETAWCVYGDLAVACLPWSWETAAIVEIETLLEEYLRAREGRSYASSRTSRFRAPV